MSDLSERAKTLLSALDAMPSLSSDYLEEVRGLFALAALDAEAAESRIEELEARARALGRAGGISNVISFAKAKAARIRSGALQPPALSGDETDPKGRKPILFWCASRARARIAALDAHHELGRWAFVGAEEIGTSSLLAQQSWPKLAGVTVYVEDLAELSTEAQIRLLERLSEADELAEPPLVMARISFASDETEAISSRVLPALLERFVPVRLDGGASPVELREAARRAAEESASSLPS